MRCEYCGRDVGPSPVYVERPAKERAMFLFRDDLLVSYSLDARVFCNSRCHSAWQEAEDEELDGS